MRISSAVIEIVLMIVLLVLVTIFANQIATSGFNDADLANRYAKPSVEHLFGTDDYGRDVMSRTVYGTGLALRSALLGAVIEMVIGVTLGLIAGFFGKWVDTVITFVADMAAGCGKKTTAAQSTETVKHDVLNIGEYDEEWVAADLIQGDTFYDLQMMMAEPLFLYNHETGELEPCLAEAPTFSADGTTMTFVVPEGRTFPNGAALGADDVCASLQHAAASPDRPTPPRRTGPASRRRRRSRRGRSGSSARHGPRRRRRG